MAITEITTKSIKDADIATADLADDAITSAKIADDAVGQAAIADESVDEARLQISNAGSNGQFLSKQSGDTGGLTWATVDTSIADDSIAEVKLDVSNAPTNGQFLQAQSGEGGGLTWADVPAGVGGATGVDFNDNVKARFGTGNDLELYHNATDSYVKNNTGNLVFDSNTTKVSKVLNLGGTTNTSANSGDIWYASSDKAYYFKSAAAGTWATTNGSGQSSYGPTGFGTQTACVKAGGQNNYGTQSNVEHYNGSSWSNATNLPDARFAPMGFGIQTAGIVAGGHKTGTGDVDSTYSYDGSSWSTLNAIGEVKRGTGSTCGCGTQSAGIIAGGDSGDANRDHTKEWDGTNWSAGGDLPDMRGGNHMEGLPTACYTAGGYTYDGSTTTYDKKGYDYDGSSWSTGTDCNNVRSNGISFGTYSAGVTAAGYATSGLIYTTEVWDGTTWSNGNNTNYDYSSQGSAGNSSAGVSFNGYKSGIQNNAEEYTLALTDILKVG